MSNSPVSTNKNANGQVKNEDPRSSLRQLFRNKRSALTANQQTSAAIDVLKQAIDHNIFKDCARVGVYLTNEGELNTQPIIEYLWAQGINVYLPVLHPFCKGYLVFLHYTSSTKMKPNVFGILEPELDVTKLCPVAQLDLILVPLVAFDEKGNRMGMGGGFYDRTIKGIDGTHSTQLKSLKTSIKTRLIGLAHNVQHTQSLPIQVWDIPLPAILTPTTLYSF